MGVEREKAAQEVRKTAGVIRKDSCARQDETKVRTKINTEIRQGQRIIKVEE